MEIQIAVAKTNKFGSSESGDTLEVVERPQGGVSVVLVDGRSSGKKAKATSISIVHKVIGLLAEGIRDSVAAQAASDHLYSEKCGTVSAYLNILSADMQTGTLVITRNNPAPVFIANGSRIEQMGGNSEPIGISRDVKPSLFEIPLDLDTTVVMYTDGLACCGSRYGLSLDVCTLLESLLDEQEPTSQEIADALLFNAIRLDQNRPADDMSVVVLRVVNRNTDLIRRMTVRLPVRQTSHLP